MSEDLSRYRLTDSGHVAPGYIDLDAADEQWPDGRPLTEASTEAYTQARANTRPQPDDGSSASAPIGIRLPADLSALVRRQAARDGMSTTEWVRRAVVHEANRGTA